MSMDTTDQVGRPTRTSSALAAVAGLGVVGLLVWQVEAVFLPVAVGAVGAGCLAASLWLVSWERWEPAARGIAGLLTVPIAAGLFATTLVTVLLTAESFLPLSSSASVSLLSLTLVTRAVVVWGAVTAVLGIMLGVRNVVDRETLSAHYWLSVQTGLLPAVVGALFVTGAFLTQTGELTVFSGLVDPFLTWLFVPGQLRTHLAPALMLTGLAAWALMAAVDSLPLAELLGDSGTGQTEDRRISTVLSVLWRTGILAILGFLGAFFLETVLPPTRLEGILGPGLYQLLVDLSTGPGLRLLLVGVIAVSVAVAGTVALLRQLARGSSRAVLYRTGPFVAGGAITVAGLVFARPVVPATIGTVGSQLPDPFDDIFFSYARELVNVFGAPTLLIVALALLVAVTAAVALLFRAVVFAGYLSDESAGYSLASAGLFVAAAFTGTLVSRPWLVFAALVGSLFVWDMGRYGTTLGSEMGRHAPTRDVELVHAGGTLAVGGLAVGAAYGIDRLFDSGIVEGSSTAVAALVGVLAGVVLLVTALR